MTAKIGSTGVHIEAVVPTKEEVALAKKLGVEVKGTVAGARRAAIVVNHVEVDGQPKVVVQLFGANSTDELGSGHTRTCDAADTETPGAFTVA